MIVEKVYVEPVVLNNGRPHGPISGVTTCQLHMRSFNDGDTIIIEPWRAKAFPVIKDLSVDRTAFDRIISSGGYVSVSLDRQRKQIQHQYQKKMLTQHLNLQHVLGVEHVLLLVKILLLCYL